MHSTSDLFMSFVYIFYVTDLVVQRCPCLMVCMDISIMGMCRPFAQMFKLSVLISSLKVFRLNSLYPWNGSMLNLIALYMLVTVLNSLMILSVIFEMQFRL